MGNHVWIWIYSHIMKGVDILDDNVIVYNLCVTKRVEQKHIILGETSAKIVTKGIDRKR